MTGGVLNAINTRLDAPTIAHILQHGEASIVIVDTEYSSVMGAAIELLVGGGAPAPRVVDVVDEVAAVAAGGVVGERLGDLEYEELLASGDKSYDWVPNIRDEWQAISLNCKIAVLSRFIALPVSLILKASLLQTRAARLASQRASCTTTAALTCWRWATSSTLQSRSTRNICGLFPCSTAMAGASRGQSRLKPERMSVCAAQKRKASTVSSPRKE